MTQRCLLHILSILFAVCSAIAVAAGNPGRKVQLGDSAYIHKKYDSAVLYYQQALREHGPDPVVQYKLGNAHFRLNHTGPAVLAYERALRLRPGFADAAENLAVIQRRIRPAGDKDGVFFINWWHRLTRPSLGNAWAVLGIACFSFPLAMLIWARIRRKWPSWLWPQAVIGGMTLSILFTLMAAVSVPNAPHNTAVVMHDAAFRTGNGPGGAINLPEGLVVKVLSTTEREARVELPDGRQGVVQSADIALVE